MRLACRFSAPPLLSAPGARCQALCPSQPVVLWLRAVDGSVTGRHPARATRRGARRGAAHRLRAAVGMNGRGWQGESKCVLLAPHHRCVPSKYRRTVTRCAVCAPSRVLVQATRWDMRAQTAQRITTRRYARSPPSPITTPRFTCLPHHLQHRGSDFVFFLFFSNVTESLPHSSAKLN